MYETVRKAWRLSLKRANQYKIVLGVVNGIVKGVYEVERWQKSKADEKRIEFIGKEVTGEIRDYFLNKRIPEAYRRKGMASPVLSPNRSKTLLDGGRRRVRNYMELS